MNDINLRVIVWLTALLSLLAWMVLWGLRPDYQAELFGRAFWILLIVAAWWLTGRVLAGK
jgi:hypothetical protein